MTLKLTATQLSATQPNFPTFVEAGAGSGKTSVLIQRYLSILEENPLTEPRHIVVITFTKDAATELMDRLSTQVESGTLSPFTKHKLLKGLAQARISTIHSFCGDLIRQFATYLNIDPHFTILEQSQSQFLAREAIAEAIRVSAEKQSPDLYHCLSRVSHSTFNHHMQWVLSHFEESSTWAITCEHLPDDVQATYFHHLFSIACVAYTALTALKNKQSALSFDDLIPLAAFALQNEKCLAVSQSEIHHIMIDEFQDTDPKQWGLIKALSDPFSEKSKCILGIVGDVKQSIYGFRQADAQQFLTVLDTFLAHPHTKVVRMADNFRTRPEVLATINTLFQSVFESEKEHHIPYTPLHAARDTGGTVSLIALSEGENSRAEFHAMAKWIVHFLHKNPHYSYSDIGILFSRTRLFKTLASVFANAGIPVQFSRQQGLYQKEVVIDLYQLIICLMQPYDPLSWVRVITSPLLGYSFDHIYWLRTVYKTNLPFQAFEGIRKTGKVEDAVPVAIANDLSILAETCINWVSHVSFRSIPSILRLILDQAMAWEKYTPDDGEAITAFLDKVETLDYECRGNHTLFLEQLHHLMQQNESDTAATQSQSPTVRVMTIHASKGLEFPIVLIGECGHDLQQKRGRNAVSNASGIVLAIGPTEHSDVDLRVLEQEALNRTQESKRLFYVACTRARDHLVFCGALPKPAKVEKAPVSFFNFLLPMLILEDTTARFISEPAAPISFNYFPTLQSIPDAPAFQPPLLTDLEITHEPHKEPSESSVLNTFLTRKLLRLSVSEAEAGLSCTKKIALFPLIQALASSKDFGILNPNSVQSLHGANIGNYVHTAFYISNKDPFRTPKDILRELPPLSSEDSLFIVNAIAALKTQPFYTHTSTPDALHEYPFQLRLGDLILDGRMDTAVNIQGTWHIIDYKTDAVSLDTFEAYSQKYYHQLALYAIALHMCFGIQDDIVGLLYFTQCQQTVSFTFSAHHLNAIIKNLHNIPNHIFKPAFVPPPRETCQACPYYFINPQCPTSVTYY